MVAVVDLQIIEELTVAFGGRTVLYGPQLYCCLIDSEHILHQTVFVCFLIRNK